MHCPGTCQTDWYGGIVPAWSPNPRWDILVRRRDGLRDCEAFPPGTAPGTGRSGVLRRRDVQGTRAADASAAGGPGSGVGRTTAGGQGSRRDVIPCLHEGRQPLAGRRGVRSGDGGDDKAHREVHRRGHPDRQLRPYLRTPCLMHHRSGQRSPSNMEVCILSWRRRRSLGRSAPC